MNGYGLKIEHPFPVVYILILCILKGPINPAENCCHIPELTLGKENLQEPIHTQPSFPHSPSLSHLHKTSWLWWHMPAISATWEAEAGKSLEPRR